MSSAGCHIGIWAGNEILNQQHGTELCNGALRASMAIEALGANTAIAVLRDIYNHIRAAFYIIRRAIDQQQKGVVLNILTA